MQYMQIVTMHVLCGCDKQRIHQQRVLIERTKQDISHRFRICCNYLYFLLLTITSNVSKNEIATVHVFDDKIKAFEGECNKC